MKPTKTMVTICVAVEVSGQHRPAEPDVGIMVPFFEDVDGEVSMADLQSAIDENMDIIQDALREADAEAHRDI